MATEEAAQGNAESMYLMYEITGDKKSGLNNQRKNGFALSQYLLATDYREGGGFFSIAFKSGRCS
ncbi:hypothetical protein ACFS4T_16370 [Pseudomonas lini]